MTHRLPVIAPEGATLFGRRPLWDRALRDPGHPLFDARGYPYLHLPYEDPAGPDRGATTRVFFNRRAYPELKGKRIKSVDLERDGDGVWHWVVETN